MQKYIVLRRALKRGFDLCLAIPTLILFSPLMVIISLVGLSSFGPPVFFRQPRPGLKGRVFYLIKFTSMNNHRDKIGALLPDHERLTTWGRFLRMTSLDELPELWNVVKGEMSIVGPRPLLVDYLPLYTESQARRHSVKPGITGWAQVNGRNAISWEEKFLYDIWYVDHWNLFLDVKVLCMTLRQVIRQEGINQHGYATIKRYQGGRESNEGQV